MTSLLLVGNPNCGKTTLFNALTGDNQRVGNWPGVTVEKKTGELIVEGQCIEVTDLPGIYSLALTGRGSSQDEQISAKAVAACEKELIVNVIDACHLERHLYLTSQLLELGKPMIVVLNMMDIARQRGITIDIPALSRQLNCCVLPLEAHKGIGLAELKKTLIKPLAPAVSLPFNYPVAIESLIEHLRQELIAVCRIAPEAAMYYARRLLEGDTLLVEANRPQALADLLASEKDIDVVLADIRYQKIHDVISLIQTRASDASEHLTAKIDRLVLNRFLALPIFFAMMYLMFLFAINIGGAFQDFFDISTDTVFVQGSAWLLQQLHSPQWLIAVVANGLGMGINTTLTFIPVIAAMFFFLALLEASGYMARAAFVVDKAMRMLGLPGKSFVPMIVGFGCNVPGIMAARTLDSERDRLLTVLMSPFMSCSARLAIYAVFVAAFFPSGGQNVVFALYVIGILMAVFTGFILRKTTLEGEASPLILELPAYHKPSFKRLWRETSLRLRYFVVRAGRLIIPICIILGTLNALTIDGGLNTDEASTHSVLSWLGQWMTPLFAPMGLHQDNWPATVGLLTGMLAKEVVVGSLNSLYAQLGHLAQAQAAHFDFLGSMAQAFWSVPENLSSLGQALLNPVLASAPDSELSQTVYGMMAERFDGKAGAFAYLLFILLYIPCVSTMAAIRQETTRRLMWFSVIWSFLIAYASAVIFYQSAVFYRHPQESLLWIAAMVGGIVAFIGVLRGQTLLVRRRHAVTNP
ncbi:ferrous iron transport protein B [Legionella rubrilucens]|uniref:Ferrous iron transport protein B n=1 Tax=Legionella rubrilucens TaxID=458 RepID=A0A0W0XQG4_9GAMM|nr:Fe(2+) transporter permease subunit FeoB [Legionella rubrilucens]KTD46756.1 ferrous iron transport protein B [Legionella rubrilucens]